MPSAATRSAVPVGLATKLGVVGSALLAVAAVLAPLLPDTGAGTSKVLVACATVLTAITVLGRMLQAAAQMLGAGVDPFAGRGGGAVGGDPNDSLLP